MKLLLNHFSAVVPAYNEARTIATVLGELLLTPRLGELIVVDDGSTDDMAAVMQRFNDKRLIYIRHERNRGKGAALRTGVNRAKHEVILFLDADLKNITAKKISKIVEPVLRDEVDLSRARFERKRGRVTEIAVKPMMRILFPDQNFDQPITGQICGKRSFLKTIKFDNKWGVDIGILLDAIESGQRIQEVDIGKLEHRAHTDQELAIMAQQVLETMIKKAGLIQHKYKLIVFTLDQTLIPQSAVITIWRRLGIQKAISQLINQLDAGELTYPEYLLQSTALYRGKSVAELEEACSAVDLEPYTQEVIKALRRRHYNIALVSPTLSPIIETVAKRLGILAVEGIEMKRNSSGILTGEISQNSRLHWLNRSIESAMVDAVKRVTRRLKLKLPDVAVVAHSRMALPIFDKVGLSIAYRVKHREMKLVADKTITVLAEVLALVE